MQYLKYNLIIFVWVFLFFMILLALGVNIEIIDRMPNSIFLIPYFPIMIKRLQDIDYKWWWALVPLVPLVILFIPWTKWENRFWPEPRVKK